MKPAAKTQRSARGRSLDGSIQGALLQVLLISSVLCVHGRTAEATDATNVIAAGTPQATESYIHETGMAGPTVMIVGGAHGNEPAGAAAAETIRRWPLLKGKLVVVARANVLALQANTRLIPISNTNLNNLNRNYPRAGKEEPARGEVAEGIWALVLKHKPAWLLDLHEGFDFNQLNDKSVGSSIIVFPSKEGSAMADRMLDAVNASITNSELKFVRRNMPIDGSLARAAAEHLHIPAMTLETTAKQAFALRVRQHEIMVHCLLAALGMVDRVTPAEVAGSQTEGREKPGRTESEAGIRIALYNGPGTGGRGPRMLTEKFDHSQAASITEVGPEEIAGGILTNYDVIIFAGGSGSKQAEALTEAGRNQIRQFVATGGGYVGICAGAYLATSGYSWSLGLINARTVSPKWRRGQGDVKFEMTDSGRSVFGALSGTNEVHYANGPIISPAGKTELPKYDVLAYYRSELAENGSPAGVMMNSPAIFSSQYQKGQVICISPHPEQTKGLEEIVPQAVEWAAHKASGMKTSFPHAE